MKFLVIFALVLATVSAFDLRNAEIEQRNVVVPVVEAEGFISNVPVPAPVEDKENIFKLSEFDAAEAEGLISNVPVPPSPVYDEELIANNSIPVAIETESRITNGQSASVGQLPYQAFISISTRYYSTWCGAVLIDKNWVLTAAHCTMDALSVTVYLGSIVRNSAAVKYTVYRNNIINHSGYNRRSLKNDISLIKIPTVAYSSTIQPVRLPSLSNYNDSYEGHKVIASGWGQTEENTASNYLRWARMQIISNAECRRYSSIVSSSNVCISTYGGVSVCFGDSGGPLVLESSKVLIGVASFVSNRNCVAGYPAGFTRVTSYLNWIQQYTGIYY